MKSPKLVCIQNDYWLETFRKFSESWLWWEVDYKAPQKQLHLFLFFLSTLINIIGFGAVQINIDYLCDCECTRAAENNSLRCSENGTLECAICKCNEGFFGNTCHCDESNLVGGSLNDTLLPCLQDPADNTTICSNQGSCICGQCVCNLEKVGANASWEVSVLVLYHLKGH